MNRAEAKNILKQTGYIGNEVGVAFDVAIKSMDKLDKIEEIVNRELIAGKHNYQTCYQAFFEIADKLIESEKK